MISKLRPSPGGTVGQHHKRGSGPSTALMFFTLPRFLRAQRKYQSQITDKAPRSFLPHRETFGEVELMGKTHIGKFNLQRGHSSTSVNGKHWSRIPLEPPHVSLAWQPCPSPILRLLSNFPVGNGSGTSYVHVGREAWKTKTKQPIPENPHTHQHWNASNVIDDNEKEFYGLWLDL